MTYWFNRSNDTVTADLAPGAIPAHDYDLAEDDLRRVVHFARTFSYTFADPVALTEPIAAGIISGVVTNGSSGAALAETEVLLRAFTPELEETLTLTTTTDAGGNYRFDLTGTPGARYTVQRAPALGGGAAWSDVVSVTLDAAGSGSAEDAHTGRPAFYQATVP